MIRRTMFIKGSSAIKLDLCNVVLCEKSTGELFQTPNPTNFSTTDYEPIGIVVIPTAHNVYGTSECGVMALKSASLATPDEGETSNAGMYWGAYGTDYPELTNFNNVNKVGIESGFQKSDAIVNNKLMTVSATSYLPSDKNVASSLYTKAIDGTFYYYNDSGWNNCAPSPYLADGSRNVMYYSTELSAYNTLSDFAGKSNTEFLCSKSISQSGWQTDATITNNSGAGYHPAACACWRFHTLGTNKGDWYLPACGELGYCYVRFQKINETIATLQTHFGKTLCPLPTNSFWSSSEYSSYFARCVYFYNGYVSNSNRNLSYCVRPFLRGRFGVRMA